MIPPPLNRSATVIILAVALLALSPFVPGARAKSVNDCHCFRDREFVPDRKFAADDYILATSFNSLLARAYDLPKKKIVLLKMQGGVDQDDLLIGLRAAKVTGVELQQLLILRDGNRSWPEILADPTLAGRIGKDPLLLQIRNGLASNEAGKEAANLLLADFFGVPRDAVRKLRAAGLNEKELALTLILARSKGEPPENIVARYQQGDESWSEIAHGFGITPAEAGRLILNYPGKEPPRQ